MNLIFDLDGTLIDSSQGVLSALRLVLKSNQISPACKLDSSLVGPPLDELIKTVTGIDDKNLISDLSHQFVEFYDREGYLATVCFDGIDDSLVRVHNMGYRMFIATNKRSIPTRKIISFFGWDMFFEEVCSLDQFTSFSSKSDMLSYIVDKHNLHNNSTTYIGDTEADRMAAHESGLLFAAVSWGYGNWEDKITADLTLLNHPQEWLQWASPKIVDI